MAIKSELVTQSRVAREFGVSRQAINQGIKAGNIPSVDGKIKKEWMLANSPNKKSEAVETLPLETLEDSKIDLREGEVRGV